MQERIRLVKGNITQIDADAIVNAANSSLMGGGGVDGAIHMAGGPEILEECRKIIARQGRCNTGESVITTGGRLPSRYVIHTVGPVWNGGHKGESGKLADCYRNALSLALAHNCHSIAFPNISTGIYGYPKTEAASIAIKTVEDFLRDSDPPIEVIFVCFDEENYTLYKQMLEA